MNILSGVILGVFVLGISLILAPILCSSLFFRVLTKIVDASEGDSSSEW